MSFQVQWFFAYYPGAGEKYHWNLYQDSDSDHMELEYCNGVVQTEFFCGAQWPAGDG